MRFNRLTAFTLGVIITAASVGAVTYVNAAGTQIIYSCVNKTTGVIRYVPKKKCAANETSLSWNVSGRTGEAGLQGVQGARGLSGDTGATGADGAKGDAGATGAKGDTGAAGPKGDAGATGAKGDAGATGAKGDAGAAGARGDIGAKGDTGAAGITGPKGDTGITGAKGDTGNPGLTTSFFNNTMTAIAGYAGQDSSLVSLYSSNGVAVSTTCTIEGSTSIYWGIAVKAPLGTKVLYQGGRLDNYTNAQKSAVFSFGTTADGSFQRMTPTEGFINYFEPVTNPYRQASEYYTISIFSSTTQAIVHLTGQLGIPNINNGQPTGCIVSGFIERFS
jgi:hypothetical protein